MLTNQSCFDFESSRGKTTNFLHNLMQSNLICVGSIDPLALFCTSLSLIFAIEGRGISQLFGCGLNAISLSFFLPYLIENAEIEKDRMGGR